MYHQWEVTIHTYILVYFNKFISLTTLLMLISGFSVQSNAENPFNNIIINQEILKKRKEIYIINKGKFVGLHKNDESALVPELLDFINSLKKIALTKNITELEKKFDDNLYCGSGNVIKEEYTGFKACSKMLGMERDSFWNSLLVTLNSGGCVLNKSFNMPSILVCNQNNKELMNYTKQLLSKTLVSDPIKIYEKPTKSSKYVTLPENYFHTYKTITPDICLKEGVNKYCFNKWNMLDSPYVGKGFISREDNRNYYNYWIRIEYKKNKFIITLLRPPFDGE